MVLACFAVLIFSIYQLMDPSEPKAVDILFWLIGPIAIAAAMYVGSYFLLVRPGRSVWFVPDGTRLLTSPDYRGLPPQIFEPIHYVDRSFVRPQLWGKGSPGPFQQQNPGIANVWVLSPSSDSKTRAAGVVSNSSMISAQDSHH